MSKVEQIRALLKSIETGDPGPVAVVNEARYVQHNPQTQEGSAGLAQLFAQLAKTGPRVNMVRGFEDGEYVFAHMEYDFSTRKICFEVFRFEEGRAVEHWDNICPRRGPNASGRSMVEGPVGAGDLAATEDTRAHVRAFVETVLIGGAHAEVETFVAPDYAEHNPDMADGTAALRAALAGDMRYQTLHRVLACGEFALSVCEGEKAGAHSAFYDLFRVEKGQIVAHWDTTETVAPKSEWKNDNGKF